MDELVSTRPDAAVRLIPNWRAVLKRAWSVRFIVFAIVAGAVEILLPLFTDGFPPGIAAGLSVGAMVLALMSRIVLQKHTGTGL